MVKRDYNYIPGSDQPGVSMRDMDRMYARENLILDRDQNKRARIWKHNVLFTTIKPNGTRIDIHWRAFGLQIVRDFKVNGILRARTVYS